MRYERSSRSNPVDLFCLEENCYSALEQVYKFSNLKEMEEMAKSVQEALESVAAVHGKVDSLIALIGEIKGQVQVVKEFGLTDEQQAAVDKIDELSDLTDGKVTSALEANAPKKAKEEAPVEVAPEPAVEVAVEDNSVAVETPAE